MASAGDGVWAAVGEWGEVSVASDMVWGEGEDFTTMKQVQLKMLPIMKLLITTIMER